MSNREVALDLLQYIADSKKQMHVINNNLQKIYNDDEFYPHQQIMLPMIEEKLVTVLDTILDDMASYFLYDCLFSPGKITIGDKEWVIDTVDDIRTYLNDSYAINGEQK